MTARQDILQRVRQGLGKEDGQVRRQRVEALLAARVGVGQGPRGRAPDDLVAHFRRRAEALASTVAVVAGWPDVPRALAAYLDQRHLPCHGAVWPSLPLLDWAAEGLEMRRERASSQDPVGVSGCFCAIAETGTLMLVGEAGQHGLTSLLPETHVALVPVSALVWSMEEGWARLRQHAPTLPRAVNFVSGPSRTGDIEQTLVLGAHGPCRVHIILLQEV